MSKLANKNIYILQDMVYIYIYSHTDEYIGFNAISKRLLIFSQNFDTWFVFDIVIPQKKYFPWMFFVAYMCNPAQWHICYINSNSKKFSLMIAA